MCSRSKACAIAGPAKLKSLSIVPSFKWLRGSCFNDGAGDHVVVVVVSRLDRVVVVDDT